jgi:putative transposase
MGERRNFSAEFKVKVVLEILREEETIGQIATRHKIHPMVLQKWKKTVLNGLPDLFADPRKKRSDELSVKESTISDLYKQVGLLSMQLEWLKKKCGVSSFPS